jgi:hypothetical protein
VSFAAITLCVASQRVFVVVVVVVVVVIIIKSARKLLDTPSYTSFISLQMGLFCRKKSVFLFCPELQNESRDLRFLRR